MIKGGIDDLRSRSLLFLHLDKSVMMPNILRQAPARYSVSAAQSKYLGNAYQLLRIVIITINIDKKARTRSSSRYMMSDSSSFTTSSRYVRCILDYSPNTAHDCFVFLLPPDPRLADRFQTVSSNSVRRFLLLKPKSERVQTCDDCHPSCAHSTKRPNVMKCIVSTR